MTVEFVVAMDRNRVIGLNNALPWHIPEDLAFFKEVTMGCPLVMGRRTHESIGRLLPGRDTVILTRQKDYRVQGAAVAHEMDDAIRAAMETPTGRETGRVMVIGGAEIFEAALERADVIHLTLVHAEYEGDTFFPELEEDQWRQAHRRDIDARDGQPAISFVRLERT